MNNHRHRMDSVFHVKQECQFDDSIRMLGCKPSQSLDCGGYHANHGKYSERDAIHDAVDGRSDDVINCTAEAFENTPVTTRQLACFFVQ